MTGVGSRNIQPQVGFISTGPKKEKLPISKASNPLAQVASAQEDLLFQIDHRSTNTLQLSADGELGRNELPTIWKFVS